MEVYVVMKNDFPEAVFASKDGAEEFCAERRAVPEYAHIFWRVYKFELIESLV